jgi:hypothetical protein
MKKNIIFKFVLKFIQYMEINCKREAGVRKAKKLLESVIRKVNSKI